MNAQLQNAIQTLKEKFNCEEIVHRGEHTLFIDAADLLEACGILRDDFGFNLLADLAATDYGPEANPRMHVFYQFYSIEHGIYLRLRVPLAENSLDIPSIEGLYPNANWHEREIYDMFGIHVSGHSDLRRILMPYEWEGYPLRKDYPLGYEEPQFTFNFEQIAAQKIQATE